jgi:hypothetical protein
MIPVQFCNYNLDYQQRLGFLKLLTWTARGVRGGKEDLLRRLESLYPASAATKNSPRQRAGMGARAPQKPTAAPHLKGAFDPDALLRREEIPSWQPGFSFQRLDRLVLWAEMLGLITASGRLAEWSTPLIVDGVGVAPPDPISVENPFRLSPRDRAYFLAVLMYHDHVLLHMLAIISSYDEGHYINARDACIVVTDALGRTLDQARGTNIQSVRARQALRDVLERVAGMEKLPHKGALLNPGERPRVLAAMGTANVRNHLAEYHAVCRFEQLTDLGLLVKSRKNPDGESPEERRRARTTWGWYVTDVTRVFGRLIAPCGSDVDRYLHDFWAQSAMAGNPDTAMLDVRRDQRRIAEFLDVALPRASRQLGAIQVHTWIFIAALDALDAGLVLEFSTAYSLLDAMRHDPRYSTYLRQSGQQNYLGRTASVVEGCMADYVSRFPIELGR